MTIICEFCEKIFASKSNLNYHHKKAKYCLEKRGMKPELIFCDNCNLGFIEKRQLERHFNKCSLKNTNANCDIQDVYKEKIEKIKTEKDNEILLLKEMHEKQLLNQKQIYIEQIACLEKLVAMGINKSTNPNPINVTNNINIQPLTQECFDRLSIELKIEHLQSIISLIDFVYENLKDKVICSDATRCTYRYKDENGKQIIDKKGKKLFKKILDCIRIHSRIIFKKLRRNISRDEKLPEKIRKISFLESGIENMNDIFLSEFRNRLSKKF